MGRPPTPMALTLTSSLNPSLWAAAFDVRSRVADHVAVGRSARCELVRRASQLSSVASMSETSVSATDELVSRVTTTF
mgnify:CR=1 FL=1